MKTSCFSVSVPLLKENMRRFWALPAIAFFAYFVTGIIPILTHYQKTAQLALFINPLLLHAYSCYTYLSLLLPIIAAVLVFRYHHHSSSAAVMHALPFTKNQLFNSNYLSGLFFSIVPVLLTGLILFALVKPVFFGENLEEIDSMTYLNEVAVRAHSDVFTYSMVLRWLGTTILAVCCIYSISIFAGMVTGTIITHLAAALGFNLLGVSLLYCLNYYFDAFLFGYVFSDSYWEFTQRLSPFTGILQSDSNLSVIWITAYILFAILLVLLSSVLYGRRNLEKTQQTFVFAAMEPAACYLLTFFGMTLAGFSIFQSQQNKWSMYLGFLGGSLAAFIIARMIVKKSLRIFDLSALKSFSIYAVAAVIFISVLAFDLTGFTERVPETSKVREAGIYSSSLINLDFRFDSTYYGGAKASVEIYKDPLTIKAIEALQQSIIDDYRKTENAMEGNNISFRYYKNGPDLERMYFVSQDFMDRSKEFQKIYESQEFKDFYSIQNMKKTAESDLEVTSTFGFCDFTLKDEERQQLLDCLDRDFHQRTYQQQLSSRRTAGIVSLNYKTISIGSPGYSMEGVSLNLLDSDKNTLNWLKEHNYSRFFEPQAADVEKIEIFICSPEDKKEALEELDVLEVEDSSYFQQTATLTGKKQIQEILDTCESEPGVYGCKVTFKDNDLFKKETSTFYYSESSAPDFIKERMN